MVAGCGRGRSSKHCFYIGVQIHLLLRTSQLFTLPTPFITALIAWGLMREPLRLQTMVASVAALCGVTLMVASGIGTGNLFGDALAMVMTVGSALCMVMVRAFRQTPVVWAGRFYCSCWVGASPIQRLFRRVMPYF